MGGKVGGGGGADAMVAYGNKALALQKDIYDETKAANAPYLAGGQSGLNELLMRMGLSGGAATAPSNRQAMLDQYKGQFTSQQGGSNEMTPEQQAEYSRLYALSKENPTNPDMAAAVSNFQTGTPAQSVVDQAGLNSYVDKLLSEQAGKDQSNPLYGSLLKNFGMEDYQADPGYQFRLSEGNKALERALASRGQFGSMNPAAAKALQDFGQQSASQEYGSAYDRFNINQGNIYNRLANIAGMGQTAVGTQAGIGGNYANAGTEILTSQGNAITAAQQAKQANKGSMFNTLLGAGAQLGSAYLMSDRRLKTDIKRIGDSDGIPLYEFKYNPNHDYVRHVNLPTDKTYIGVMADDIEELYPDAVMEQDGFKKVNYSMLGLEMMEA